VIIPIAIWWATLMVGLYAIWLLNPFSLLALAYQAPGTRSRHGNSIATLIATASVVIFTAICTPRYAWSSWGNILFWMTAQCVASYLAFATQRRAIHFFNVKAR
jgi:hypothetical protein